jgi:autonomous glycyl radical cofactor GrcA
MLPFRGQHFWKDFMTKKIKHITVLKYNTVCYIEASCVPKVLGSPSWWCNSGIKSESRFLFGTVYIDVSLIQEHIKITEVNLDTFINSLLPKKEADGYFVASYEDKDVMKLNDVEYIALKDIEFHQKYHNIEYVPSIKIEGRHYVFLNVCTKESPYYITKEA